ncbi:glutamate carboxypeptidase 2 [Bimuria novae-zelandiae CBS 107.79]|uniref:Glutamate carboxypeptidase 2 n=1 Tax=Bimuria novae-zelandiae CBS 107.79 TaxID=1447943 RepID=A0A6A5VCF8_9PLEO|nr:glutamate carboxypeptidase 2 [Bimuria novae-zelandiae CBS 107.79]
MPRMLSVAVLLGGLAYACQKDWDALARRSHHQVHNRHAKRAEVMYSPSLSEIESILINSFENKSISDWSYYYTHGDHLGSHNKSMADRTVQKWKDTGLDAWIEEFPIWYTYPEHSSLTLIRPDNTTHEANLVEDILAEDDTSSYANLIPAYHAMSASGDVTAQYVYVGRGTRADFQVLKDAGIELKGKIALANYGGLYRGTKAKNVQDNEMITEKNGYEAYPNGPARNPSSIQRGSVRFSSLYSGDPTIVGYASSNDSARGDTKPYNPSIPSIPLSMKDALLLLAALEGNGQGGFSNATYNSGPTPGALINIDHLMEQYIAPVWDVIGFINGTSPDEVVVLANAFGKLLAKGWKPRRTIIFSSWDAEEFSLQGSTEWVETHLPWLQTTTVAYLNMDVGVSGPRTNFEGSGEIQTFVVQQMKKILFPEGYGDFLTIYDMWYNTSKGSISPLRSSSNYASFYQNGIAAIDVGSSNGPSDPVYHYHSNYDSYHWMSTFADPDFRLHTAMGQFFSLVVYHIAEDPLIPWDLPHAARVLSDYLSEFNEIVSTSDTPDLDLTPLADAIAEFTKQAERIDKIGKQALVFSDTNMLGVVNSKYRDFPRGYASAGGLPRRETFKNTISAPGIDNGYGADVFPAETDNVNGGNQTAAEEWIGKTAKAVLRAAEILQMEE